MGTYLSFRLISRSEQAPGSEFQPRDESEKSDCGFLGPSLSNKKVNPETYVPFGSYELFLSSVAHQISLKSEICSFFSGLKQQEKTSFERNCKLHFLPRMSCQLEFHFSCRLYLLLGPPDDVLSEIADLSHYFKCQEKIWIWK